MLSRFFCFRTEISCELNINATEVSATGTRYTYTGKVRLECKEGYEERQKMLECLENGEWNDTLLQCTRKTFGSVWPVDGHVSSFRNKLYSD